MEKRWPWKKKTSADVGEATLSDADYTDDKIRHLNEKLLVANDCVIKHANVAEEAVSGWEKAKTEQISMQYQLDIAVEQKQAADVRVLHLDGALKECMQHLRQVREEQEETIHEAIMKRSKEWQKLKLDLEERLGDVEGQLMDSESKRNALCKSTQEQAEAVARLARLRSEAETVIKNLQAQVQTLEERNGSLKYEIVVLNKELGIRNEEIRMNTRSLEVATHQHMEGSKRIAQLESDCQRLRALVRKKLPGPKALLQMKLESGVHAGKGDDCNNRKSITRTPASPKVTGRVLITECQARTSQRLPLVAPKSPEFHAADSFRGKDFIPYVMSEDGYDDDQSVFSSWTSSPIRESLFLRGKGSPLHDSGKSCEKIESINDFLELERFVSLPFEKQSIKLSSMKSCQSRTGTSEKVLTKVKEPGAAIRLVSEEGSANPAFNCSLCSPVGAFVKNGSHMRNCTSESAVLICKVIRTVKDLASNIMADFRNRQHNLDINCHNEPQPKSALLLSELESSLNSFNAAGDAYLYGKADLIEFMSELYSILDELSTGPRAYKPLSIKMRWRVAVRIEEQEIISDVGSPFSTSSNSDCFDLLARKDSSLHEMQKIQSERQASMVCENRELMGITKMDCVVVELKQEKLGLETKLQEERSKLDFLKAKLEDSEQLAASLRKRLTAAELSGMVAEKSLASITAAKAQLEARLQDSQHDVQQLREKVMELEFCNEQEKGKIEELKVEVEDLRNHHRVASDANGTIEKTIKEQEITDATAKCAECRPSILGLGQPWTDAASGQDGNWVVASHNAVQDDDTRGHVLNNFVHAARKIDTLTGPEAFSTFGITNDGLTNSSLKASKYTLQENAISLPATTESAYGDNATESQINAKKRVLLSLSNPDSKENANLLLNGGKESSSTSSALPHRKHAKSFSKFFSRQKSPS